MAKGNTALKVYFVVCTVAGIFDAIRAHAIYGTWWATAFWGAYAFICLRWATDKSVKESQ